MQRLIPAAAYLGRLPQIYPAHLKYVNAIQVVTIEQYEAALQILEAGGGVVKSGKANKRNEDPRTMGRPAAILGR